MGKNKQYDLINFFWLKQFLSKIYYRFGGSSRDKKKQTIIEKLKAFFEKYFGIVDSGEYLVKWIRRAFKERSKVNECIIVSSVLYRVLQQAYSEARFDGVRTFPES